MSDESIKPPTTSNKVFISLVDYIGTKIKVKFNGMFKTRENYI